MSGLLHVATRPGGQGDGAAGLSTTAAGLATAGTGAGGGAGIATAAAGIGGSGHPQFGESLSITPEADQLATHHAVRDFCRPARERGFGEGQGGRVLAIASDR